ncbi:hypothetical protein ABZ318_23080 [Streptomyces sp. NPDC006197]|uniref:hypothetical protein n=1 Tax=Streptomyces sp. NPDC006197 TaxID=3156685 RepID=UPI0033AA3FC7
MTFVLIVITAVTAGWALVARGLERGHVRAPVVLVLAGVVTGVFTHSQITVMLNSEIAQHVAEVILAVLLFVLRPAETLVRDTRIAARVRDVPNVESGYNDGIISPVTVLGSVLLRGLGSTPLARLLTASAAFPVSPEKAC